MGQNLASYAVERPHMTAKEVLSHLARQVPGRSIGDYYVISSKINNVGELELEVDDGCKFAFTCRKVN